MLKSYLSVKIKFLPDPYARPDRSLELVLIILIVIKILFFSYLKAFNYSFIIHI